MARIKSLLRWGLVLFCVPKENQKSTRYFRGAGTDGLRLPASASLPLASCWPLPQQLLPVSAAGGSRRRCKKGAARPFQTPKELSKHKNASRFAKRIFCTSPVYGSADGVTFQQDFTFCKGVKSAAKQQMGETRKKRLAQRQLFSVSTSSLESLRASSP